MTANQGVTKKRKRGQELSEVLSLTSPLELRTAYNRYGGYCVPVSSQHRPAAQIVLGGGVWEPNTLAFMAANCGDGDIVHAGAYFGDFLPALSRACAPGAKVWAFEPSLENFRCARLTVGMNHLTNVELANLALSSGAGQARLRVKDPSGFGLGGASQLVDTAEPGTETTATAPLDSLVPHDRRVTIVQLDVELHEREALEGAMTLLKRHRPLLILEVPPNADWIAERLLPLGYRWSQEVDGNAVLTPGERP